jgi:hypothetical protein
LSPKLTPEELGRRLEEMAEESAFDRCEDVPHEEAEARAREAGVNVEAVCEMAKRLAEMASAVDQEVLAEQAAGALEEGAEEAIVAEPGDEPPPPVPSIAELRAQQRGSFVFRWGPLLAASAIALVVVFGLWKAGAFDSGVAYPPGEQARAEEAHHLRAEASDSMEKGDFAAGLRLLDQAKDLDPEGDKMPGIQEARKIAKDSLASGIGKDAAAE